MAIFVPILGNLRGSIGANTFSHNRGGDYLRRRVGPINKNSTRQQTMRALLSSFASTWALALSDEQRNAWNAWAAVQAKEGPLGNTISLTGINAFVWTNCHVADAGDGYIADPPANVAPNALLTFSVDISANTTAVVTFTGAPVGPLKRVVMFMSLPQPGEAEPNFKQCRIVGYSDINQDTAWNATLPFAVGVGFKVIFFGARYDSETGLFSQFLRAVDTADYA